MDRKEHKNAILHGALYATAAVFLFSVMNALAKELTGRHHVIEIGFYRNLIGTILLGGWILAMRRFDVLTIKNRKIIFARATIGSFSLVITFAAFQALPMANAQMLMFTSALLIPVLGFFFLKERVGPWRWGAAAAGFAGVWLITGPSAAMSAAGVTMALGAALCHAVIGVMLRHLGKSDSALTITFYFIVAGLFLTGIFMPWVAVMPAREDLLMLAGLGTVGTVAQFFLSCAYARMPATLMGIFSYSGLIWATMFDWMLWDILPQQQVWAGGAIVIASTAVVLWRENRAAK